MKNIIITGTSRGIGLELAQLFASAGHNVLALSRKSHPELLKNPNVTYFPVDLAEAESLDQVSVFLESWKTVDAIVHNAGALLLKPFEQITTEDFERIYRVNVFGVAALNRICLPFMGKGAHVVTISSMGGVQGTMKFSGLAAYSSSKGAVITLSELLAEEYKESDAAFLDFQI